MCVEAGYCSLFGNCIVAPIGYVGAEGVFPCEVCENAGREGLDECPEDFVEQEPLPPWKAPFDQEFGGLDAATWTGATGPTANAVLIATVKYLLSKSDALKNTQFTVEVDDVADKVPASGGKAVMVSYIIGWPSSPTDTQASAMKFLDQVSTHCFEPITLNLLY